MNRIVSVVGSKSNSRIDASYTKGVLAIISKSGSPAVFNALPALVIVFGPGALVKFPEESITPSITPNVLRPLLKVPLDSV